MPLTNLCNRLFIASIQRMPNSQASGFRLSDRRAETLTRTHARARTLAKTRLRRRRFAVAGSSALGDDAVGAAHASCGHGHYPHWGHRCRRQLGWALSTRTKPSELTTDALYSPPQGRAKLPYEGQDPFPRATHQCRPLPGTQSAFHRWIPAAEPST